MKSFIDLPDIDKLNSEKLEKDQIKPLKVNNHFHTPYSFSAFISIDEMFNMADEEDVGVLGINDFITTDGYEEFFNGAVDHHKFPMFNIEFMGMIREEQARGILVNDPDNPGRTYFCGKGLAYPVSRSEKDQVLLDSVLNESQKQTHEMVSLLNDYLKELEAPFELTFKKIQEAYAKEMVRERHIAKALRIEIKKAFHDIKDQKAFLKNLYGGIDSGVDLKDNAALDNELRGKLLKAGGKAYVPENEKAFLEIEEIRDWVINVGGIPTYPVLLDNKDGNYTEYEEDPQKLYESLSAKKIFSIELIPGRNDFSIFKNFVHFFYNKGYIISFGTEHNTPVMQPLTVACSNGVNLDAELMQISYLGVCVIAAHQYLVAKGLPGFVNVDGTGRLDEREEFEILGDAVIRTFINS